MESRKTAMMTILLAGQQRQHIQKEQTFGHSGGMRGWDDLREKHLNIYITICKTDNQWEFDVWHKEPKASALWQPRGVWWGKRWEGSKWGDLYTPMTDSCGCMVEAIIIL